MAFKQVAKATFTEAGERDAGLDHGGDDVGAQRASDERKRGLGTAVGWTLSASAMPTCRARSRAR